MKDIIFVALMIVSHSSLGGEGDVGLDQVVRVSDYNVTLCRVVGDQVRCGDYSVKDWPIHLKGAKRLIDNCIPQTKEYKLLKWLNDYCDSLFKNYGSSRLQPFYAEVKACQSVWKSAALFREDRKAYYKRFRAEGCLTFNEIVEHSQPQSKPDDDLNLD